MRYAVMEAGSLEYLTGEAPGPRRGRSPDLSKAKLFHRRAGAEAHVERWKGHSTRECVVVPVEVVEAKELRALRSAVGLPVE